MTGTADGPAGGPADVMRGAVPLVLRVLDHQLVGPQDQMVGNVDDLEVREDGGRLVVTGILSGPAAMALRQGGRGGRWLWAIWRRLHPQEDPRPAVISLDHVRSVDSAVHVSDQAARVLVETAGLELWLRRYVVSRIPGALGGGEEHEAAGAVARHRRFHPELDASVRTHMLSDLLGAEVVTADGAGLGKVTEVVARATERTGLEVGPLTVEAVVCSTRHLGAELGYTLSPQGPLMLQWMMRRLRRRDRLVPVDDFDQVDWDAGRVTLGRSSRPRHPHAVVR
jgi:hypothetical protein